MGPKLGGKFFFSVCEGLIHIHDYYFDATASPNFKQTFESSEAVWKSVRVLDEPAWPCTTALLLQNLWAPGDWGEFHCLSQKPQQLCNHLGLTLFKDRDRLGGFL